MVVPCKGLEHIVMSTNIGSAYANHNIYEEQRSLQIFGSYRSQFLGLVNELSYNMDKKNQVEITEVELSKSYNSSRSIVVWEFNSG